MAQPDSPLITVGVSLKMYFGFEQTREWCARVAQLAREHPAVAGGDVELFVIPDFVSLTTAVAAADSSRLVVGAQDIASEDSGAFTGEVSGVVLAEVGCGVVEVGHAERRRLFGETDEVVAAKTSAALRNGIAPVLCIGEKQRGSAADAVSECLRQLESALSGAPDGRVVLAYEPVWAIGAATPAEPDFIRAVTSELRARLLALPGRETSVVIYGGSAGPGLLTRLEDDVDGLFLGRFAHDPEALAAVLDEAAIAAERRRGGSSGR